MSGSSSVNLPRKIKARLEKVDTKTKWALGCTGLFLLVSVVALVLSSLAFEREEDKNGDFSNANLHKRFGELEGAIIDIQYTLLAVQNSLDGLQKQFDAFKNGGGNGSDPSSGFATKQELAVAEAGIAELNSTVAALYQDVLDLESGNNTGNFVTSAAFREFESQVSLNISELPTVGDVINITVQATSDLVSSEDLQGVLGGYATLGDLTALNTTVYGLSKEVDELQAGNDTGRFVLSTTFESTISAINQTLESVVTQSDLENELDDYVTSSSLLSTLEGYATSYELQELQDQVDQLAAGNGTARFVLTSTFDAALNAVNQTLAETVTQSDLSSELEGYVTSSSLASTLEGYVTNSDLEAVNATLSGLQHQVDQLEVGNDTSRFVLTSTFDAALGEVNQTISSLPTEPQFQGLNQTVSRLNQIVQSLTDGTVFVQYATFNQTVGAIEQSIEALPTDADLQNFVNASSLSTTLQNYVTASSLSTTLQNYVTTSSLSSILASYVTSSDLQTDLEGFVDSADLQTALQDYVTSSALQSDLENYVTEGEFNSSLTSQSDLLGLSSYSVASNMTNNDPESKTHWNLLVVDDYHSSTDNPPFVATQYMDWTVENGTVEVCSTTAEGFASPFDVLSREVVPGTATNTYLRFCPCPVAGQSVDQPVLYQVTLTLNNLYLERVNPPESNGAVMSFGFVYDDGGVPFADSSTYVYDFQATPAVTIPYVPPVITFPWTADADASELHLSTSSSAMLSLPAVVNGAQACYKFIHTVTDLIDNIADGVTYGVNTVNSNKPELTGATYSLLQIQKAGWIA